MRCVELIIPFKNFWFMSFRFLFVWIFMIATLVANKVDVQFLAPKQHDNNTMPFVLVFTIPEHAHIYGPDDKDSPTTIEWSLPQGVTLERIVWPSMKSISLHGHSFEAYEGKVYVHGNFVIEDIADLKSLRANINYIVCDKLCTPEKTSETLNLVEPAEWTSIPKPLIDSNIFTSQMALMLLFAFLGGIILNLMPCVLPILSLKIMALTNHAHPKKLRENGVFFALGTIVSFWILAGLLLVFRAVGHQVGWGFQLQSPSVVTALILVFFAFALNLFGVFEIGTSFTKISTKGENSSTPFGSFLHGILACIVATPCSAPFMGASVGFALTQSPLHGFLIFTSLALGLSAPYLLVCLNPKSAKFLPKPGAWMNTFKTLLGFGMISSVLWLLHVLADQVNVSVFLNTLIALLMLSIACWVYGHWGAVHQAPYVRLLAIVVTLGLASSAYFYAIHAIQIEDDSWMDYNPTTIEHLRKKSPVLVDFTAKWCITCQVNKRLVLDTKRARDIFKQKHVQLIRADWTTYDPAITKALEQYGRSSVPLYVLLYPNGKHKVLPEILTMSTLEKSLADLE